MSPKNELVLTTFAYGMAIALTFVGMLLLGAVHDEVVLDRWRARRLAQLDGAINGTVNNLDDARWQPHFAWTPVKTEKGNAWLRIVEKIQQSHGSSSETCDSWWEYREMAGMTKSAAVSQNKM
jgi:hypothetical protein